MWRVGLPAGSATKRVQRDASGFGGGSRGVREIAFGDGAGEALHHRLFAGQSVAGQQFDRLGAPGPQDSPPERTSQRDVRDCLSTLSLRGNTGSIDGVHKELTLRSDV